MSENTKIRVLLVDDNDVLRMSMVIFIETFEDLQFVGEATNGLEAVELCAQVKPDVILMDLIMPVMDGIAATRIILERFPSIKVIALTSFDDEPLIRAAQQAGIYNYLLKNIPIDTLANAIRAAYHASQMA